MKKESSGKPFKILESKTKGHGSLLHGFETTLCALQNSGSRRSVGRALRPPTFVLAKKKFPALDLRCIFRICIVPVRSIACAH